MRLPVLQQSSTEESTAVISAPARGERAGADVTRTAARFSETRGAARGRTARASAGVTGTVDVYAQAIADYWDAALAAGHLDFDKPLYVLELQATEGRFTYLLMRALRARLRHRRLRYRHLAADTDAANLAFIDAHPYLQPDVADGHLETVLWDPADGSLRHRDGRHFVAVDNPLVVLADRVYADLAHDLLGFHYGRMYEGRVAAAGVAAAFEWSPIAQADWLPRSWAPVLAEYTERLTSASMLLPSGAMRCVDRIREMATGGYLLLAADEGAHTEEELRMMCGMDAAANEVSVLPVNYHALARHQAQHGARVWCGRSGERATVHHVALCAPSGAVYDDYFSTTADRIARLGADDYLRLNEIVRAVAEHLPSERLLNIVRLSRHDPQVLDAALPFLLPQFATCGAEARSVWREALELTWSNYFPVPDGDPFHFNAGLLAMQLEDWAVAKQAFALGLALYREDAATWRCLGQCEAASGDAARALECLSRACALDPNDRLAHELHTQVSERLRRWNDMPWYRADIARDDELAIEPLGREHAESVWYQYRDPQIGVMTRLPELTTLEQTIEWIETREPDRATYAVMHADWGFVGAVSFRRHADAAYFYFWIGTDYQNRGLGRRAAAQLFRQAEAQEVRAVYTSAYPDNVRSRRALTSLGFTPIDIAAAAPDDELLFFWRPLSGDAASAYRTGEPARRLRTLCAGIDSPLVFPSESVSVVDNHD